MIVAVLFVFGVVLLLGLGCLGVRLATRLKEVDVEADDVLEAGLRHKKCRITYLLGEADRFERESLQRIRESRFAESRNLKDASVACRETAEDLSKELGLRLP